MDQAVHKVFLSHKKEFSTQAEALARALDEAAPGAGIFRSEDIGKARDWRVQIHRELENAKCFILLYTDPKLDWSWCFYEAGAFMSNRRKPRPVQRLSIGARLAVRTKLEVLDAFLGRTSQVYREKVMSNRPEDEVARNSPVGGRMVEALDAIWREALSHGMRPDEPAPRLFEGAAQNSYEKIRNRGKQVWDELKRVAQLEDEKGTGDYSETEHLLADLKTVNEDYLALVLPRIEELLVPAEKRPTALQSG